MGLINSIKHTAEFSLALMSVLLIKGTNPEQLSPIFSAANYAALLGSGSAGGQGENIGQKNKTSYVFVASCYKHKLYYTLSF